ncbi:TonB-dependent receptor [Peristeroidobacter soli]|uniref:TonB-dependent receptor n=1 Tax=Peristeroidobacter soli TaxID=2497877 RepID=UPI00101D22B5|nr:TonB-dependent receptor [Peristeroidobacter soli]
MSFNVRRHVRHLVASTLLMGAATLAFAQSAMQFDLPRQPLADSLRALGAQARLNVLFDPPVVADVMAPALHVAATSREALEKLLAGTGLQFEFVSEKTVAIRVKEPKQSLQEGAQLQEIVVTGSRIARAAEGPQDVKRYSRAQIEQSGQTTLADFFNTLPEVSVARTENGYTSLGGATTVQLRGLPLGTTLVLVDGRRVVTSGAQGGTYFDLNNIPLAAVERVEILAQGSSAIYGSDAIAGVVNIALKEHLDGFEGHLRYGAANDTDEQFADLGWGRTWERGNLSVIGSYQTRSTLTADEREVTTNAVGSIEPLACNPGNVFSLDGSPLPGLGGASYAAVPSGASGTLTTADFLPTAGTLNSCNVRGESGIIPKSERVGMIVRGEYALTPATELFFNAMLTRVDQASAVVRQNLIGVPASRYSAYTLGANNPFNPFGQAVGVTYFFDHVPIPTLELHSDFMNLVGGARGKFGSMWDWELVFTDARDDSDTRQTHGGSNVAAIQSALNSSDPATALNPLTTGVPARSAVLDSLFFDWRRAYEGRTMTVSALLRGEPLMLPAGAMQLAVGAEYNRTRLSTNIINELPYYPLNTYSEYRRQNSSVFAEARLPLIGGDASGARRDTLGITLAGRFDDYDDFGSEWTPQVGLEWRPHAAWLIRADYGRAFKAPSLYALHRPQVVSNTCTIVDPLRNHEGGITTCVSGGNPGLDPETGRSTSFGVVYADEQNPDLQLSITHWDLRLEHAVQSLSPQTLIDNEPLFGANVTRASSCIGGLPCPITRVDSTAVNFGELQVAGLDYRAAYAIAIGRGKLQPSLAATQTYKYDVSLIPGAPSVDAAGFAQSSGNWAPRWRGSASLAWQSAALSTRVVGRYVGRYTDYDGDRRIGNFWLMDASAQINPGAYLPQSRLMQSFAIDVGVVNLLDRLPQVSSFQSSIVGYDPAQGDIRGRYVYVQLTGRWQ